MLQYKRQRCAQIIILGTFLFSSCMLQPPYQRETIDMPEQWRDEADNNSTVANIDWWRQFGDPILNALIIEALNDNQDLAIATARISEYRARLGIVNSNLYPQIGLQAFRARQKVSQTLPESLIFSEFINNPALGQLGRFPIYTNDFEVLLNASYELDLWGKLRSASAAAFADLLAQVEARSTVVLSLVAAVANSYVQLRSYDQQLIISQNTYNSRMQSAQLAQIRFKEGLTSELEVKQAEAEADEAAIQVIEFETLIEQQENLLCVLLGHAPTCITRGKTLDTWQEVPSVPAGLPSDLLEQRPDIRQAEEQLIAANARIGEAKALFFPDITLTGYYGFESAHLHNLFTNPSSTWQWVINLLQPIFTGGRIANQVDLSNAVALEAYHNYQQVILNALREVNDALIAHRQAKRAYIVQIERVHDLEEYLKLARIQYDNGLVDYLNVLDAERSLFRAQLDLAQTQASIYKTLIALYKALGGGWVIEAESLLPTDISSKHFWL